MVTGLNSDLHCLQTRASRLKGDIQSFEDRGCIDVGGVYIGRVNEELQGVEEDWTTDLNKMKGNLKGNLWSIEKFQSEIRKCEGNRKAEIRKFRDEQGVWSDG